MFFLFLAVFKGHMVFKQLRETCNFDLAKFGPNPRSWGRVMFKKLKKLRALSSPVELYRALESPIELYRALESPIEPYRAL